jgi:hypothetical protein
MRRILLAVIVAACSPSATAADEYIRLNCRMDYCSWGRVNNAAVALEMPQGRLVRATTDECQTYHKNGRYPRYHTCAAGQTKQIEHYAFCSRTSPNMAVKSDGKWLRTKLSISADGEAGYNLSAITLYLWICHRHVRRAENLDMVGRRLGYRSRTDQLKDGAQDEVRSVTDLAQ